MNQSDEKILRLVTSAQNAVDHAKVIQIVSAATAGLAAITCFTKPGIGIFLSASLVVGASLNFLGFAICKTLEMLLASWKENRTG